MKQTTLNKVYEIKEILVEYLSINSFCLLLTIFLSTNAYSQNKNIISVNEALKTFETVKAEKLKSYLNDLHTTVYFENGEVKTFGDGAPTYAKTDVNTIKKLSEKNTKLSQVEILQIKLNEPGDELKLKVDPSTVSGLTGLKYILVRSSYELSVKKFEDIFSGFNATDIIIFYEVSIPN